MQFRHTIPIRLARTDTVFGLWNLIKAYCTGTTGPYRYSLWVLETEQGILYRYGCTRIEPDLLYRYGSSCTGTVSCRSALMAEKKHPNGYNDDLNNQNG
ncbi:hypothetical protein V6N11_047585 [Hibiscus sabdariffa]|uniref:Uncharacterized protein n=1 Tax=Hibiscus sabdariffa TaxID=183260 RepID=A0ABR2NLH3_9ROSI